MKALVAYYSRTNITEKLAKEIAKESGADLEKVTTNVKYTGKIGYARAGKDAMTEKIIDINELKHDPADYDIIYLGGPVWASKAATPLISYMKQNEGKFKNVKFFATAGKSGFEQTFAQMQKYVAKSPLKTLALTTKEVKNNDYTEKLAEFLE